MSSLLISSPSASFDFKRGSFLSSLTLSAYLSVFKVGSQQERAQDTLAIIVVLLLPVNESFKTWVSLLPLKGKWFFLESRARMHSLRANRLLLISAPSYLVFLPVSMTSAPLSLPARSMKLILLNSFPPCLIEKVKMACDREDSSLAPVVPLVLDLSPLWIVSMIVSTSVTCFSVRLTMLTRYLPSSLHSTCALLLSKSYSLPQ